MKTDDNKSITENGDQKAIETGMTDKEKRIKKHAAAEEHFEQYFLSHDFNYEDALSVLLKMTAIYRDKGNNLLNAANIQEIVSTPRFTRN